MLSPPPTIRAARTDLGPLGGDHARASRSAPHPSDRLPALERSVSNRDTFTGCLAQKKIPNAAKHFMQCGGGNNAA